MRIQKSLFLLSLGLLVVVGCRKVQEQNSKVFDAMLLPAGFPAMNYPADNLYTLERWQLGKMLFYDKALSLNYSVSCASCHQAALAFSDNVAFSLGDQQRVGKSNAPTLGNIGYNPYFTRAGGVPTLEMQILVPIQEHDEFNFNIVEIAKRLNAIQTYKSAALKTYEREVDPFVITRAIACFERSFISGNSTYDKFFYQYKKDALTANERKGMDLFFSTRTNCSQCHSGFNFSNYAFENNGLYENYKDNGRMRLTQDEADRAKFKVPSLRNIELTAPYMHDGSFARLEDVIEHYNSGGKQHIHKSEFVKPLGLTESEKQQLLEFLKSLTDYQFINNSRFKNE